MRGLVVSPSDILVLPVYPTSPLIPHPPPSGNTYSSPPKEVTLDESPPMNGTGMSRKERSKRKVRKGENYSSWRLLLYLCSISPHCDICI